MDNNIDILKIFLEFLEVSIHQILFLRKLYPDGIFTMKKKYGVPVHVSMYPDLNDYITESLLSVKKLVTAGDLRQVDVCFFDRHERPIEKYIFSLDFIKPHLTSDELLQGSDPYLQKLHESFRAYCLKLAVSCSYLKALPDNAIFRIHLHTTETSLAEISQDPVCQNFPLIEVERFECEIEEPCVVPVRTLDTELFRVETYIQQQTNS